MYKTAVKLISILPFLLLLPMNVSADIITYYLSDKQPGALAYPDYGLRLDDLFSTPTDESNWTFSFDDPGASVQMDIDTVAATAHIHGTVVGGLDIGEVWDPATIATWNIDFLYSDNVTINDTNTGYWSVTSAANNFGWLKLVTAIDLDDGIAGTDEGRYIALGDYHGGSFVGNGGPNPSGPFVSAWLESTDGFINSNQNLANETYVRPNNGYCCKDFGFRANPVPEPSTLALMALGIFGVSTASRFRRKS